MVKKIGIYQIEWTNAAIKDIRKIYQFYCKSSTSEVAKKIINPIFYTIITLKRNASIGQEESCLTHFKRGHRYLVCGLPENYLFSGKRGHLYYTCL